MGSNGFEPLAFGLKVRCTVQIVLRARYGEVWTRTRSRYIQNTGVANYTTSPKCRLRDLNPWPLDRKSSVLDRTRLKRQNMRDIGFKPMSPDWKSGIVDHTGPIPQKFGYSYPRPSTGAKKTIKEKRCESLKGRR